jgi:hypothetical protein
LLVGLDLEGMASRTRRRAGVDGPSLSLLTPPVPGEIFDSLVDVVSDSMNMGGVSGSAHGDVSEFSPATVGEEMGGIEGGTLASMNRGGVPVGELVGCDLVGSEGVGAAVVRPHSEADRVGVDRDDLSSLGGDQLAGGGGGEGDDAVPRLVCVVWRKRRLRQVERQYGDRLDEVADFLADFAAQIKAVGPKTYLESVAYNERDAKRDRQRELDELSQDRRR